MEDIGPLADGSIGSRISFEPATRDNIGEYYVVVTSCIAYGDLSKEKCEDGKPFTVTIVDPCYETNILADIFLDQMARPQLQTTELNLRDQIPFGNWPW